MSSRREYTKRPTPLQSLSEYDADKCDAYGQNDRPRPRHIIHLPAVILYLFRDVEAQVALKPVVRGDALQYDGIDAYSPAHLVFLDYSDYSELLSGAAVSRTPCLSSCCSCCFCSSSAPSSDSPQLQPNNNPRHGRRWHCHHQASHVRGLDVAKVPVCCTLLFRPAHAALQTRWAVISLGLSVGGNSCSPRSISKNRRWATRPAGDVQTRHPTVTLFMTARQHAQRLISSKTARTLAVVLPLFVFVHLFLLSGHGFGLLPVPVRYEAPQEVQIGELEVDELPPNVVDLGAAAQNAYHIPVGPSDHGTTRWVCSAPLTAASSARSNPLSTSCRWTSARTCSRGSRPTGHQTTPSSYPVWRRPPTCPSTASRWCTTATSSRRTRRSRGS